MINCKIGEEKPNNQGCLMRIVYYQNARNIIVEFQDKYKHCIKADYSNFQKGTIKNPFYPSVYNVGIVGEFYKNKNLTNMKEYKTWYGILQRCYDSKFNHKYSTYHEASCCDEWLLFENFYRWLHQQNNFEKWLKGYRWDIDKDILCKGNKKYAPNLCTLVPHNVNSLFTKSDAKRGNLPIGVSKHYNKYQAACNDLLLGKRIFLGDYDTPQNAFVAYKEYKEKLIKQIAKQEYQYNNITQQCYQAMLNYKVEITD